MSSSAAGGDHMPGGSGLPAGAQALSLPLPLPMAAPLSAAAPPAPPGALRAEFALDGGGSLPSLTLAYSTYGRLGPAADNAVVVGHSLTSDSRVSAWWGPLLGAGPRFLLDTDRYYVVCANVLGSVYGSSGPRTGEGGRPPPGPAFPVASVRDNVRAQHGLLRALGVRRVAMAVGGSLGGGGAGVIRMLRLVRIFRVFKVARYLPWVRVFSAALAQSVQPLLMLVLIILIGVVIFASLMYYVERGEWDAATGTWLRTDDYGAVSASPFSSIPAAMWWAVITMTTVGYGDMFPVTTLGRLIATVAALSGVLVVAVPITIISTNFNAEAARLEAERSRIKARMLLLQHHFAAKRAGLDAVLDEVTDIVRRNAQELEGEVATLLEQTRDELTMELQEIVRMAYEKRRMLHLHALTRQPPVQAQAQPTEQSATRLQPQP